MAGPDDMWGSRRETALYTRTEGYGTEPLLSWDGRGAGGFSLGIIELMATVPFAPGNINNASTFDFPVRYESLGEIDPMWVVSAELHPKVLERSVAAAQKLEQYGCRAIIGNCGFFGNYQQKVAAETTVPFFGSSLLQIPFVLATLAPSQKVGVLTADGSKLEVAPALENCGVTDRNRVVIYGVENEPEATNILNTTGHLDLAALERDLVNVARHMVDDNADVGAVVLECTEFPPHAHAIQEAVRMPVWGFTTMAYWVHSGVIRHRYTGWA